MPHDTELTESLVRHADDVRAGLVSVLSDLTTEGEARHVDEWRLGRAHDIESDSELDGFDAPE